MAGIKKGEPFTVLLNDAVANVNASRLFKNFSDIFHCINLVFYG